MTRCQIRDWHPVGLWSSTLEHKLRPDAMEANPAAELPALKDLDPKARKASRWLRRKARKERG